ncbi:MAG TPA: cytochrome c-type biogenesis protein [Burkholderiales bacterium]|nr:cytochrome c-type biogenesis protein [Burkholderiales bacterium]
MRSLFAVILLVSACVALAREAVPESDDPVLEKRVVKLTSDLRCLVCQNQSLADSHADLAIDLKNQVREQMRSGKSDAEIRDYMVARYGDFVLYDPPFKATTLLLWVGPFVLMLIGLAGLAIYLRGRRRRLPQAELTPAEHARAEALLRGGEGNHLR